MQREKKRGEKKQGMEGSLCAPGLSGVSCVFVFFSPSPPLPFFTPVNMVEMVLCL